MFITDQHRGLIRGHLKVMEAQFEVLQLLKKHTKEEFEAHRILRPAAERALHIAIESVTDIGNIIIDALVMRDAASYEDIFVVLTEENVFPQPFADHFLEAVRFRKLLVHEYTQLTTERVWQAVQEYADDFAPLQDAIAAYVKL